MPALSLHSPKYSRRHHCLYPLVGVLLLLCAGMANGQTSRQNDPGAYIFYWGVLQAPLKNGTAPGSLAGEIVTSPAEFKAAVLREPRLWDGKTLRQQLSFQLDSIPVRSDYYVPDVYGALRPGLENWAARLDSTAVLRVTQLRLPDGNLAEIRIFLSKNAPAWLRERPEYNFSEGRPPASKSYLEWGPERFDGQGRQFFTVPEFWAIVENEPTLHLPDGSVLRPGTWKVNVFADVNSNGFSQLRSRQDSTYDLRRQLEDLRSKIQPGNSVYFSTWDSLNRQKMVADTIYRRDTTTLQPYPVTVWRDAQSGSAVFSSEPYPQWNVAMFALVAADDPRLGLRKSDRRDYLLRWGPFEQRFFAVFGRSFRNPDGSLLRADDLLFNTNNKFTRWEILDLLRQPARLTDAGGQSPGPLQGRVEYQGQFFLLEGGMASAELLARLERDLAPYERVIIRDLQAGAVDFSFAELIFEVRNDDPKPPIRQR